METAGFAIVGLALSAASAGATAAVGYSQAQQERQQYEQDRKLAELDALQEENARKRQLADVLGAQQAIRSARNADIYSPTSLAIADASRAEADRDIGNIRLNAAGASSRLRLAGRQAKLGGIGSIIGGIGDAGGGLLSYAQYRREAELKVD